jgi:hypothetical protein
MSAEVTRIVTRHGSGWVKVPSFPHLIAATEYASSCFGLAATSCRRKSCLEVCWQEDTGDGGDGRRCCHCDQPYVSLYVFSHDSVDVLPSV